MDFSITFFNVLILFIYLVPAFILGKVGWAKKDHLKTMSAVLVYINGPAMVISSFLNVEYTNEKSVNLLLFALLSLLAQGIFIGILFLILRKKLEDAKFRILTVASVCGNVGFFGLPLIKSLLPESDIAMCYSSIFVLTMNIIAFTLGTYCVTKDKKYISIKSALINPTTIALVFAIPMFVFSINLPDMVENSIDLLGKMTTPLCMIILGIRLANVDFKALFSRPIIYLTCGLKLFIFPLFVLGFAFIFPINAELRASLVILSSVPCASLILNLAEIHDSEQELAANAVLLSTLLSILTIPIVLLVL